MIRQVNVQVNYVKCNRVTTIRFISGVGISAPYLSLIPFSSLPVLYPLFSPPASGPSNQLKDLEDRC